MRKFKFKSILRNSAFLCKQNLGAWYLLELYKLSLKSTSLPERIRERYLKICHLSNSAAQFIKIFTNMGRDLEMIFTVLSLRVTKTPNDNWLINDMFIQRNIVIMNCFVHI